MHEILMVSYLIWDGEVPPDECITCQWYTWCCHAHSGRFVLCMVGCEMQPRETCRKTHALLVSIHHITTIKKRYHSQALTDDVSNYWLKINIQFLRADSSQRADKCDDMILWFLIKVWEVAGKKIAQYDAYYIIVKWCYSWLDHQFLLKKRK